MNAAHTFHMATTTVSQPGSGDGAGGGGRKYVTAPLCQTVHPEEKRKIIGDTFMRVANELVQELNLKPEDVYLGQGTVCLLNF